MLMLMPGLLLSKETNPYKWEEKRQRYELSPEEEQLPEIILKDHIAYTYAHEDNQFVMYSVYHRIVRVNTAEAIQRHNRISISMDRTIALEEVRARSISPQNVIVSLDINNLKEVNAADGAKGMKIFAMEGVELGSEIEYYYVRKMTPFIYNRAYFQLDVPVKNVSFELRCPNHLVFDFKSYNGLPNVTSDTAEMQNIYRVSMSDVPPLTEEPFAFHMAKRKRIEFKLAYNTAKSRARMYTWDDAGKHFYGMLYELKKEEEKALEKFVKELRDDSSAPLPVRIRSVERKVKSTFQLSEGRSEASLDQLASILKYKVASKYGLTRLFLHVFPKIGITVQPVITCSREYAQFDSTFDTWNYLDEYVLFFPETKGFLAPYNLETSYPLIDTEHINQKGLLIEPIEVGSVRSGLATIHTIPATSYDLSTDNLDITVNFNADFSGNLVNLKREMKGYNAMYIAPYYHLMTDEQKLSMIDNILKQTASGLTIEKWEGKASFDKEVDQFDMNVTFTSSHFIERAGPRILFKAGLLIGPQSELYRDDKRLMPVENTYNRGYERVLKIILPEGYSVKNPDDLNFNVIYEDDESTPFSFVSNYSIDGAVLTVTINEYYKEINAPLERYEDYRKVINAAADFNKVVLVLEKI